MKFKNYILFNSSRAQFERIKEGTNILIGTPGRVNDFLGKLIFSMESCEFLVLDEADRMLDMGKMI